VGKNDSIEANELNLKLTYFIFVLNNFFGFVNLQNNLKFYNLLCLSFVHGLKCKWISVQKPRLIMRYKSLIKTALDLGLVRLKLVELVKIN
jgi:hypothetical protein